MRFSELVNIRFTADYVDENYSPAEKKCGKEEERVARQKEVFIELNSQSLLVLLSNGLSPLSSSSFYH